MSDKRDFLDECKEYFNCNDLYEILGVDKTANEKEIKSAYRKKSLKVHPDRASDDRKEYAKRAFQVLTKVHYVLTNESARKFYDETGRVITDDDSDFASFTTFEQYESYWRNIFPKISTKQIDEFLEKYIGSEEEKADLKALYVRFEGNMDLMYEHHYSWDEERIVDLLNELIETEEIPSFDAFVNERKSKKQNRLRRIEKERMEAEKEEKRMAKKQKKTKNGGHDENDDETGDDSFMALQMAIKNKNQNNFGSMIANLEAKYGGAGKKGGRGNKKPRNK